MNREKGLNIDVTRGQYMMLYNIMCEHNQMVNPQANPDFDLQTFDINNHEAIDKNDYVRLLKLQYLDLYNLEIKDYEITNIEEA